MEKTDIQFKIKTAEYVRNFVFGVEDSLVSTVGLISGIAAAGVSKGEILITGIVLIFVESFSMAIGSFLSKASAEEYLHDGKQNRSVEIFSGMIMFFSYFLSGFVPLFPYAFFNTSYAFRFSIFLSLVSLFVLGLIEARISKVRMMRSGLRMLIIGGIALGIGVAVGGLLGNLK